MHTNKGVYECVHVCIIGGWENIKTKDTCRIFLIASRNSMGYLLYRETKMSLVWPPIILHANHTMRQGSRSHKNNRNKKREGWEANKRGGKITRYAFSPTYQKKTK